MTYTATGRVLLTPCRDENGHIIPNSWDVLEPLVIWKDGERYADVAPFTMDLASIPVLLRLDVLGMNKTGRNQRAAVCHDWLYENRFGTRAEADRAFLDIMKQDGVPRWRRYVQYWAVRIGGKRAWEAD